MSGARVSRWSRRFVAAGAAFLCAWALAAVIGLGRRPEVTLALYGFVLHTLFGKAYALVPSYFDRDLVAPLAPAVQWPLTVAGTVCLAVAGHPTGPDWVDRAGAVLWAAGVAVFVVALGWTIRDNLSGAETGTGDHQADRRPVDRLANAVVPVALGYLLAGAYGLLARSLGLPTLVGGPAAATSHLFAAGVGALFVFGVGFRLFPRLLVADPPRVLVWTVLPAGAVGPALVAVGVAGGPVLHAAVLVEGVAVLGFAVAYAVLFVRSDRRAVGFYAVGAGALAGVALVALAAWLAVVSRPPALVRLHYRFALVGFLGLTIVGAATRFYPPSVGDLPGATDRTAAGVIAALAGGLALQVPGTFPSLAALTVLGELATVAGALGYAYLLAAAFRARPT